MTIIRKRYIAEGTMESWHGCLEEEKNKISTNHEKERQGISKRPVTTIV